MLQTLLKEVKEYKGASLATPAFMVLEVLMEMTIPYLMASIIDKGVNAGDMQHIYKVGGVMVLAAAVGTFCRSGRRSLRSESFCRLCKKFKRVNVL